MNGFLERHGERATEKHTWDEARRLDWIDFTKDDEAWDAKSEELVQRKLAHLRKGPSLSKDIESTAKALQELGLQTGLLEQWWWDASKCC